jgi:hypothetical protein
MCVIDTTTEEELYRELRARRRQAADMIVSVYFTAPSEFRERVSGREI